MQTNPIRAYLSKVSPQLPPGLEPETPGAPVLVVADETEDLPVENSPSEPAIEPEPPDSPAMLDEVASFLGQYLACDEHQLAILALWVLHTWCFNHFATAVYLNIRSPEPQSGKTRCLELLEVLCNNPWMATGAPARTVFHRLLTSDRCLDSGEPFDWSPPYTTLMDDCQQTFGPSERQSLLALLRSGSRATCVYVTASSEYSVFGPKAFAGNAPLPRSLDACCIPIVLRRQPPSAILRRFYFDEAYEGSAGLRDWLSQWSRDHSGALEQGMRMPPPEMPVALTPRERECAEPLLHAADLIGGHWPEKARAAISAVFNLAESSLSVQLLFDIRALFLMNDNPEYFATRDLLAALAQLEHRAWSAWPRNAGRRLAALLYPFGIRSRDLHYGSEPAFRGYLRRDFQDAFERYLPPVPVCRTTKTASTTPSPTGFSLSCNGL